jgi:hypothetical protein
MDMIKAVNPNSSSSQEITEAEFSEVSPEVSPKGISFEAPPEPKKPPKPEPVRINPDKWLEKNI